MDTETIDRLFLELSQFTKATTANELALRAEVERLRGVLLEVGRSQRSKDRTYSTYTELLVKDDLIEKIEKEFEVPLKSWLMGGDEEG